MLSPRLLLVTCCLALGGTLWAIPQKKTEKAAQFSMPIEVSRKFAILKRLTDLGPLPTDRAVRQDQLDEFSDIIASIDLAPPDPDYIRPLLLAFGPGDGYALYTHGVWALMRQDPERVLAASLDAMEQSSDGPRQWALETVQRLRGKRLIGPPSHRELQLIEDCLRGPPLVAEAAVYTAYHLDGEESIRLLEVAKRVSPEPARTRAAELLLP